MSSRHIIISNGRTLLVLICPVETCPFLKRRQVSTGQLKTWASYREEAEEEELDSDDDDDRDLVIPLIHNHDDIIKIKNRFS